MTDNIDDRITRLKKDVDGLRAWLDQVHAADDKFREEAGKACEQVIALLEEVGAIEILRAQVPPYRRYVVDRLEAALRLLPARLPNSISPPAGPAGCSPRRRRSTAPGRRGRAGPRRTDTAPEDRAVPFVAQCNI
jgi:hypothetical protein